MINPRLAESLNAFTPISLAELNNKAEMLDRLDNKYILTSEKLLPAFSSLINYFDVLEIESNRAFQYSTCYFDDHELHGYYDHHQQRRKRCKVRVRQYVDAGISFLEVKLNEKRTITVKRRKQIEKPISKIDLESMRFVKDCYKNCYGENFEKKLHPVLVVEYKRITFVAKEGGERLTMDCAMEFKSDSNTCTARPDMFIVETKSKRGNGIADKIFRSLHLQPTSRVSKFCIGMVTTEQVWKRNGFLPALRKLQLNDASQYGEIGNDNTHSDIVKVAAMAKQHSQQYGYQ